MSLQDQFNELKVAFINASKMGDGEALSYLFADDAILLTPKQQPALGREAIKKILSSELKEAGGSQEIEIETLDFQDRGDTGYAVGTWAWEAGGENGTWVDVVERQSNGSVLFTRICWN